MENTKKLLNLSIILFSIAILFMILGLVTISSVENGFLLLKTLGAGAILQKRNIETSFMWGLSELKAGIIMSIILTPTLAGLGVFNLLAIHYKRLLNEDK